MLKRIVGLVAVTSLAVATATTLVACASDPLDCTGVAAANTNDEVKQSQVALVIAPTTTFVDFPALIESSLDQVKTALGKSSSRLNIVLADGKPGVAASYDVKAKGKFDAEIDKDKEFAIQKADDVYSCAVDGRDLAVTNPIKAEQNLDLFEALRVAADSFDIESPNSANSIIVLSNGLQTAGQWQMQTQGIPSLGKATTIVDQLKAGGVLPNLNGATVDFVGLGHVSSAQEALNQQSIDGLEYFWTSVVKASNGLVGSIQREVSDTAPSDKSIKTASVTSLPDACVNVVVTEDMGAQFNPGTAVFKDTAKAAASAKSIASQVAAKPSCTGTMTVTGYVASGVAKSAYVVGNPADASLSLARANAFKDLLAQAGVKVAVRAVGGGKGPFLDWNASGAYDEKLGQKNRIVIVAQDGK